MPTVTGISIEFSGSGYTTSNSVSCLNLTHGECDLNTLFVDITVDGSGGVIGATPTEAKTGLDFEVDDLVYVNSGDKECILRITSVEG